jgi:(S)-mandelate dehydrogenase
VVTLDSPTHAKRTLDLFNGVTVPFRPSLRLTMQASTKLSWAASLLREGQPTCPNMSKYVRPNASLTEVSAFVRDNVVGCVSWDDLRLIRRAWPGHPILKGIMSSQDALFARDIGADGVFVSNHGGRQLEASAASVDVLPAIADALAGRVSLLMDGGVRSGSDAAKALALGADAAFAGRAFLTGVAALGDRGAQYTIDMLAQELEVAMTQLGVTSLAEIRSVQTRHPGEWRGAERSVQPMCAVHQ